MIRTSTPESAAIRSASRTLSSGTKYGVWRYTDSVAVPINLRYDSLTGLNAVSGPPETTWIGVPGPDGPTGKYRSLYASAWSGAA